MSRARAKLQKLFGPYLGPHALDFVSGQRQTIDLLCVVSRLQAFESLTVQMDLQDLGALVDRYYALIADAAMQTNGDVNRFSGPTIVCHYGVLQPLQAATVLLAALGLAFGEACKLLRAEFEVNVGVGVCFGTALCGRFGSAKRCSHTAVGPPEICASKLADRSGLSVCERYASRISGTLAPQDPWLSVNPHWRPPGWIDP